MNLKFCGRHISIRPKTDRRESAATAKEFLEPSDWRDGKFNYDTIQFYPRKFVLKFQSQERKELQGSA